MDFFSPLEEDMVSRTEQDEDQERIAMKARKRAGDAARVFAVVRALDLCHAGGGPHEKRT